MSEARPRRQKAFLDTTVPCDRILGDPKTRALTREKLSAYRILSTSKFVQLEFSLSLYGECTRFQARVQRGEALDELCWLAARYAGFPPPFQQRRVGSVMVRMFAFFVEHQKNRGWPAQSFPEAFGHFLRLFVRGAWSLAFKGVRRFVDPSGSLGDLPQPCFNKKTRTVCNVATTEYAAAKAPQLAVFIRREEAQFKRTLSALRRAPGIKNKAETRRRVNAIRRILAGRDVPTGDDIRNVGDALIAVECPRDHVLLTSNTEDFAPIAKAIGKLARSSLGHGDP
jgi:hypothetical protein